MQLRRSLLPLMLTLSLVGSASSFSPFLGIHEARADEDTTKIRAIFQDGLQLEAGGNYAGALAKFQEVAAMKRTPNVFFHIALCQEKLGRLVAAVGGYKITVLEGGNDPKSAMAVQAAQEALATLEKRVPSLTIKRGKGSALAKITLDGTEIGAASLGIPQQVDPGSHAIEAILEGKLPFKETVEIEEGEAKTVEVTLKEKPDSEAEPAASASAQPPRHASRSIVPYVVLGTGVASLAASGLFFYLRSSAISDLDGKCIGNVCPTDARSTSDSGKTSTLLGNITLGLGVVGVGVGAVLLLTSKPSEATARARPLDLVLHPNRNGAAATLVGRFLPLPGPARRPPAGAASHRRRKSNQRSSTGLFSSGRAKISQPRDQSENQPVGGHASGGRWAFS